MQFIQKYALPPNPAYPVIFAGAKPYPCPVAEPTADFYAHPTAVLDAGCRVGAGSRIWHFCHLATGAVLGENCSLGQNVFVADGVTLGRNVKVQNNVSLYEGVVCEDDVFLGPSVVFTNVRNPRSAVPRRGADHYLPTYLERGVSIGANATLVCGLRGRGQRGHAQRAGLCARLRGACPAAGLDERRRPPAPVRRSRPRHLPRKPGSLSVKCR